MNMFVSECRVCKGRDLQKILSLGESPPANNLLAEGELSKKEASYPLELLFCRGCSLVQLSYVVNPEVMFKNYLYVPSKSETFIRHFEELAQAVCERPELKEGSLVVDIGSNDGTLLKSFKKRGMKTLGVEPAENMAETAKKSGIETIVSFFDTKAAKMVLERWGKAKAILATNVFAHVDEIDEFLKAVNVLLDDDGVFVVEVQYILDMIEGMAFDNIYHEHVSYFSLKTLVRLFERFGMGVIDAKKMGIHGGSLRVYVKKGAVAGNSVNEILKLEEEKGLGSVEAYLEYAGRINQIKKKLLEILGGIKKDGKSIAGYGAPAKATTLLNYFGIGKDVIDFVVDRNELKQGMHIPGVRIPIFPVERLEGKPDYLLILAWNLSEEIMKQEEGFGKSGGKFIIPVPEPRIV